VSAGTGGAREARQSNGGDEHARERERESRRLAIRRCQESGLLMLLLLLLVLMTAVMLAAAAAVLALEPKLQPRSPRRRREARKRRAGVEGVRHVALAGGTDVGYQTTSSKEGNGDGASGTNERAKRERVRECLDVSRWFARLAGWLAGWLRKTSGRWHEQRQATEQGEYGSNGGDRAVAGEGASGTTSAEGSKVAAAEARQQ